MAAENQSIVPAGAWDTHIHIFDPQNHPYAATRAYTPASALIEQYPRIRTGCSNIVIVQGTVQGTDNTTLLDVLNRENFRNGGSYCLRGLVVLNLAETSDEELDKLHAQGVRGFRLHEVSWGFGPQGSDVATAEKLRYAASRLNRLDWVIDVYVHPKTWAALVPTIDDLPTSTKIVADHWGCLRPGKEDSAECQAILDLLRRRRIYVKLASIERQTFDGSVHVEAMGKLAKLFIAAGPDRLIFGSDWPHTASPASREGKTREERLTNIEQFRKVDLESIIKHLRSWFLDESAWQNLWVSTPQALFA